MRVLKYELRFTTPAFLGNAEQSGQWRTPPIKALLRQWWRIVHAPKVEFDVAKLRADEACLFGVASDARNGSRRSLVMLRLLDGWSPGQLMNDKWPHRQIQTIAVGPGQVRADVYLGFGPVLPASKKQQRPDPMLSRSAIDPEKQSNHLRVGFDPKATPEQVDEVREALKLAAWFGGVGSRSRNGWGSILLQGDQISRVPQRQDLVGLCQPLTRALQTDRDWPHAIGEDGGRPLVWIGARSDKAMRHWRETIFFLASVRRDIRAAAKRCGKQGDISANQLLAYPVTNANNNAWGNDERLAGALRFKVTQTGAGFLPIAVHLPCALPERLSKKLSAPDRQWVEQNQHAIWQAVHARLDQLMIRIDEQR